MRSRPRSDATASTDASRRAASAGSAATRRSRAAASAPPRSPASHAASSSPSRSPGMSRLSGVGMSVMSVGLEGGRGRRVPGRARNRRRCRAVPVPAVPASVSRRCVSATARRAWPRWIRDFTVPTGIPSLAATSAYGSPCTSWRTTARRVSGSSAASAAATSPVTLAGGERVRRPRVGDRGGVRPVGQVRALRAGPPGPAPLQVDARVHGDPVQPRGERRPAPVRRGPAEDRDERVLGGVLGVRRVPQAAVADRVDAPRVPGDEPVERRPPGR